MEGSTVSKNRPNGKDDSPENLPPVVRDLLDNVIQGQLMRYDVLRFFQQNPYAILTVSDLSVWVSREERPLADTLQQLAVLGYLAQSPASSAFTLTPDRERRRLIEEFFGFLEANPDLARRLRLQLRRRVEAD